MKKQVLLVFILIFTLVFVSGCSEKATEQEETYTFPVEDSAHEGTWLVWPHHHTYGMEFRERVEDIWVEMVRGLHTGENVHIVAYDEGEETRIKEILSGEAINMENVDFTIAKSDDVWVRDTGPIFVVDSDGKLIIANFEFDGWGEKAPYEIDNTIPTSVADSKSYDIIDIPDFVLEGGSFEVDGKGTLMAAKSSVVSKNRNPDLSVEEAEAYLTKYLGVSNFIWLEGVLDEDITDAHIDGTARFIDSDTILTLSRDHFELLYENIDMNDYEILMNAKNADGDEYAIVEMPLTENFPPGVDYEGCYLNYYIGNEVILLPVYDDPNDEEAISIVRDLYPDKDIIPIDVTALYPDGGMIHCVTQQQPKV